MYRSYGLYLAKHFVVVLTNVCTVKVVQKPENLGKARTYLTSMSTPKQGKTTMNHNREPAGT